MGSVGLFFPPISSETQNRYRRSLSSFSTDYCDFYVPSDFDSITKAVIPISRVGSDTSPYVIWKYSNYSGHAEATSTHSESVTTETYNINNAEDVVEMDISDILTGIAAGDFVGLGLNNRDTSTIIYWNGIFEYSSSLGTPLKIATIQAYRSTQIENTDGRRYGVAMTGAVTTYANLVVPLNFNTLVNAYLWFRHSGLSTGDKDIDVVSRYGGDGEAFDENTESDTITVNKTVNSASTYQYDISSVLTGISAGQSVGLAITNSTGISTSMCGGVLEYT